jgi:hypothetical protein
MVIFYITVGKLTENCRKIPTRMKCVEFHHQGERKTVGKFRRIFRLHRRKSSDLLDPRVEKVFRHPYK